MLRPRTIFALAAMFVVAAPGTALAQDRFIDRFALRLELGGGLMLSPFQRNDDPAEYQGNTKGYSTLSFEGSARLGFQVVGPITLQLSVSNWVFPSTTGAGTGWVFHPTGGLRIEPQVGSTGRFFIDGNVGPSFTGLSRRIGFDAGVGFEFDVSRVFSIGPVLRYGQVIQPETLSDGTEQRFPQDARYVALGASLAWRAARDEESSDDGHERTRRPRATDHDNDGILDSDDQCPTVPVSDHPDPARVGCPDNDTDSDSVFDAHDQCPSVPRGEHPDPDRVGCPDGDSDNDTISDHNDLCPGVPQGPRPDAARPGCPEADADRDGLTNSVDRCPDRPETFNNFEDDDGCPDRPPLVTLADGVIRILGTINFVTGSDRIVGRQSFDILDALVAIMAAHAEIARAEVQGHTDDRGDRRYNLELSQRRANAVRLYLIEHGIGSARIEARGYGMDRPQVPNTNATSRAQNRRVEMHVLNYTDGSSPSAQVRTQPGAR
jgi:outer membrane protein OmpA-like peptidoglycan-associated protein